MRPIKIIVERHADGFVAYPVGLEGVVVAEGETDEEAISEVRSAIAFHVETFGAWVLGGADPDFEVRTCNGDPLPGNP